MQPQAVHSREAAAGDAVRVSPLVDTRETQCRVPIHAYAQPAPATPPQAKFLSGIDSWVSNTEVIPHFSLS